MVRAEVGMKRHYNRRVQAHWTRVHIPQDWFWAQANSDTPRLWCMQYEGKGRYYHNCNGGYGEFYFECGEDATMFALVWL